MHSRHDLVVMRYDRHENRHAPATRLQMPGHGRRRNRHVCANTRWHWDVAGEKGGVPVPTLDIAWTWLVCKQA